MEYWTTAEAAAYCGVSDSTWRKYVSTGRAPKAAPFCSTAGARLYDAQVVRDWHATRPGRGARTDLATPCRCHPLPASRADTTPADRKAKA